MEDWNADLYSYFSKERIQPVIDLVNRLDCNTDIRRIIDIGCGSGMSTKPLLKRWPSTEIIGVDYSDTMLNKAKEWNKDIRWLKRDCNNPLEDLGKFDLVFSNAALQWLNDQGAVIKNLSRLLNKKGVLAMQIPDFDEMQISRCIRDVAASYGQVFDGIEKDLYHCGSPVYYYNELAKYFMRIELWETDYYHVMNSQEDIIEFISSTGLRPYLSRLDEEQQKAFLKDVLAQIKIPYNYQEDGKVLFTFKRIFFIADQTR